jgi:FkbM family methyltransferase
MILGTRRLFLTLLRTLRIELACDVGSMNGAEALAFRRALPRAGVLAFEPNPNNLRLMLEDPRLAAAGIQVLAQAVSDVEGPVTLHLVDADYTQAHHRRGMSSLYERANPAWRAAAVTVDAVRLDRRLGAIGARPRIALWLDVEGKAYEALCGARDILAEVQLLHVEVESRACFAADQRLYPQVRALLEAAGLVELAVDCERQSEQFNALYVRRDLPVTLRLRIAVLCALLFLRHRAVLALRRLCPGCLQRLLRWRDHSAPTQRANPSTSANAAVRDR